MSETGTLAEKRELAAKVLREVLEYMGIDAEVSAFDDGERIILDAHGSESGLVIGKKGATLDALQYLVNRIVFKKPGEATSVIVDAEGYRGRREDSLTDLARRLAEKAVADHPDVTTESEGEGMARRVVIFPKRSASLEAP
jgi:spoIIIJ-associated protein